MGECMEIHGRRTELANTFSKSAIKTQKDVIFNNVYRCYFPHYIVVLQMYEKYYLVLTLSGGTERKLGKERVKLPPQSIINVLWFPYFFY